MKNPSSASAEISYFDLHTTGIGYLNRIREVPLRKGEPFLACSISALNGPSNDVQYVKFDTRVSGHDAQQLVRQYAADVEARKKVLIGFRLGDPWTDIYTPEKGDNAGQPTAVLKARLLYIFWIKVDGKRVYTAPKPAQGTEGQGKALAEDSGEFGDFDVDIPF